MTGNLTCPPVRIQTYKSFASPLGCALLIGRRCLRGLATGPPVFTEKSEKMKSIFACFCRLLSPFRIGRRCGH